MYVLQFPLRTWPRLKPVFDQQGLTSQVRHQGDIVIAEVDDEQAVMLKLDSIFDRFGPIGGWEESRVKDCPQTQPADGRDFS
jgi:hypothetical protein